MYTLRSAFCSLSIIGRTPSAMMITPTPRAMSPQDIVRIYVPPAPPEESPISIASTNTQPQRRNLSASNQSLTTSATNRPPTQLNGSRDHLYHTHRQSVASPTPSNASTKPTPLAENGDATPRRRSLYRSEEELNSLMLQMYSQFDPTKSTSSSRRGSLSRKSPSSLVLHDEHARLMMECSHIPAGTRRRSSSEHLANAFHVSTENVSSGLRHAMSPERKVLMTSFEELAQKRERMVKNDTLRMSQESLSRGIRAAASASQYVSESNIEYRPLRRPSLSKNGEGVHIVHSGTTSDVIDAYPTTVKPYSRYFGGNVNDEDVEDDDDYRNRSKSSDGSSSSPNSKSVVSTPVNESIPLLVEKLRIDEYDDHASASMYSSHPAHKSRIPQMASPPSIHSQKNTYTSPPASLSKQSKIPLFHKAPSPTDDHSFDEPPVSPRFHSSTPKRQRQQVPPLVDQRRQIPPPSTGSFADLDSRIAAPLGGVYQFTRNNSGHQSSRTSASSSISGASASSSTNRSIESGLRKPTDMNKIRIKINQNQRN